MKDAVAVLQQSLADCWSAHDDMTYPDEEAGAIVGQELCNIEDALALIKDMLRG